jgi:LDH2 family malate/lactate/ureidoglycolate dehydrogenase
MKDFGREPLVTSAFYLAIDPERFMPLDEFRSRIDRLVDHVKASELASGVEEVFIAGEPEARRKADRLRDGIPISDVVLDELRALGQSLGIPAKPS